jgi:hypothetical protein
MVVVVEEGGGGRVDISAAEEKEEEKERNTSSMLTVKFTPVLFLNRSPRQFSAEKNVVVNISATKFCRYNIHVLCTVLWEIFEGSTF